MSVTLQLVYKPDFVLYMPKRKREAGRTCVLVYLVAKQADSSMNSYAEGKGGEGGR